MAGPSMSLTLSHEVRVSCPDFFTACPCSAKQLHNMWQPWSQGPNNVTAPQAPRQPVLPRGSKWIWFFYKSETVRLGLGKRSDVKMEQVCFVFFHICCYTVFTINTQIPKEAKDQSIHAWEKKIKRDYLLEEGLQMSLCIFHVDKRISTHLWISNQPVHVPRDLLTRKAISHENV